MNRRLALRSLAAACVAPLAVLVPRRRDPLSLPARIHVDDPGAQLVQAVYVDGEKIENAFELDTAEGWVRYVDLSGGGKPIPRIRHGIVTHTTTVT